MKKIIIMILILVIFASNSYAETIPKKEIETAIHLEDNVQLELKDENIYINVMEETVSSVYQIENLGNKKIEVEMKFPAKMHEDIGLDDQYFNVFCDGKQIDVATSSISEDNTFWYLFKIVFEKNETKTIMVSYKAAWEKNQQYGYYVNYDRNIGGPWDSTIAHSIITFDFGEFVNYYRVNTLDNGVYRKVDSKYIWESWNYKPKESLMLEMKLKLLEDLKIKTDYYKATLEGRKILIDVDNQYAKNDIEKDLVNRAAIVLQSELEKQNAEVCISTNIVQYEKEIKKQAKFDYVITLICDKSSDIQKSGAYVAYEQIQYSNEEKYLKSKEIAKIIASCGIDGIANIVPTNSLIEMGTIDIGDAYYMEAPRVIVSLGYTSDVTQKYNEYNNVLAKVKLGITIYDEIISSRNDVVVKKIEVDKNSGIVNNVKKYVKYNLATIVLSIIFGIIIGVSAFIYIIVKINKKIVENSNGNQNKQRNKNNDKK